MIISSGERTDAAKRVVEFCRFTREKGISSGVQETLGALESAVALGVDNEEALKFGLRSILCGSKEDWDLFEECFQTFWRGSVGEPSSNASKRSRREFTPRVFGNNPTSLMSTGSSDGVSSEKDGSQAVTGASARERLTKADLSTLPQNKQINR